MTCILWRMEKIWQKSSSQKAFLKSIVYSSPLFLMQLCFRIPAFTSVSTHSSACIASCVALFSLLPPPSTVWWHILYLMWLQLLCTSSAADLSIFEHLAQNCLWITLIFFSSEIRWRNVFTHLWEFFSVLSRFLVKMQLRLNLWCSLQTFHDCLCGSTGKAWWLRVNKPPDCAGAQCSTRAVSDSSASFCCSTIIFGHPLRF